MLPKLDYLEFASRWFANVRFDLASSGLQPAKPELLGPIDAADLGARARFRLAVSKHFQVPVDQVVPCLGTSGGLLTALWTALEPGRRVLVETPGYEPLFKLPSALGLFVDRFERDPEQNYALTVESVLRQLTPATELVIVSNPHNPTGIFTEPAELEELARALHQRKINLLVDEAYAELVCPGFTARKLNDNLWTCSSTTKSWGMPWSRSGWLLLPERLAERAPLAERLVCGQAPPSTWAFGERAFSKAEPLTERARSLQKGKREIVERFAERHNAALGFSAPHGESLFGWFRDRRGRDLTPLIEQGITDAGVIVAPGRYFGDASAFRLSWTAETDVLSQGLDRLAQVLKLEP